MDLQRFLNSEGSPLKGEIARQLKKIKQALAQETVQTREMIETYQSYIAGNVSKKEMDKANEQFLSFLKTLGLGVLAVLPFSPITIPAMVKLGKKVGIDILPNSFKSENISPK